MIKKMVVIAVLGMAFLFSGAVNGICAEKISIKGEKKKRAPKVAESTTTLKAQFPDTGSDYDKLMEMQEFQKRQENELRKAGMDEGEQRKVGSLLKNTAPALDKFNNNVRMKIPDWDKVNSGERKLTSAEYKKIEPDIKEYFTALCKDQGITGDKKKQAEESMLEQMKKELTGE